MLYLDRYECLGDALRDTIITHKTNVALIEVDRHRENARYTYRELEAEANRFAALIQGEGFAAGDRCAIIMQNQSKWLLSATGAMWSGAVLIPLDYKLTAPEQMALLAHAKPRVLVVEYPAWVKLREEPSAALEGVRVLVTEAPAKADLGPAQRWEAPAECEAQYRPRAREDVACIVYSSGTGGTPKGCQLTHANYLAQAQTLGRLFPIEEDDRYFSILPTNHAIDFMAGYILPLLFGAAIVHQRTLRAQFLGPTMREYGVTHMAVVPTLLRAFERKIKERLDELEGWQRTIVDGLISVNEMATRREPKHGVSRWLLKPIHDEFGGRLKQIFCGGAFTDRGMAEYFYRLGIPVIIGYGLTEAGTVLTVNDLKPFRGDSVGAPVDGTDVEIRNPNDQGVGEVWVRGPTVMKGYLDEPELTAEAIVDGWLRTGDLGVLDAAGHLKLRGRAKNMIVTAGGKNIYPEDIESTFEDLPDCEELCVFAADYVWPSGKLGDEALMVVLRPKDKESKSSDRVTPILDELRERNRKLADFKRVTGYVIWDEEFPRTASMKVKRNELRDALAERARDNVLRPLG